MAHYIVLSKNQKASISYIILCMFLVVRLKKFLDLKISNLNKIESIKTYASFLHSCWCICYCYIYLKIFLIQYKNFLFNYYIVKKLTCIEHKLTFIIFSIVINFGYLLYQLSINLFLEGTSLLIPNFKIKLINLFYFLTSILQNEIFIYLNAFPSVAYYFWNTIKIFFFITHPKLLIWFYQILSLILLGVEILLNSILIFIFPPARDMVISFFSNFNLQNFKNENFSIKSFTDFIEKFIKKWLQSFHREPTILHKVAYVLVTIIILVPGPITCILQIKQFIIAQL